MGYNASQKIQFFNTHEEVSTIPREIPEMRHLRDIRVEQGSW